MDFSPVIQQLISLILSYATSALLPMTMGFIAVWVGKLIAKIKNEQLHDLALSLVKAAQQSIPEKSDRYAYVAKFISSKYKYLKESDIQHLIEAAVYKLKNNPLV